MIKDFDYIEQSLFYDYSEYWIEVGEDNVILPFVGTVDLLCLYPGTESTWSVVQ
jgi:hypothetical protein